MKVQVHWDKKINNAKFNVPGKDIKSAVDFLNARGQWGNFNGNIKYKCWGNTGKVVYKVRLIPSYVITMPNWPAYRNQTQKIKDSWDTMYKALKKHEGGHREIFQQGLNKLIQDIQNLSHPSLSDFLTNQCRPFKKSRMTMTRKQNTELQEVLRSRFNNRTRLLLPG